VAAGWRVAFIAIAAVSLLWVIAWAILGSDGPRRHPGVSRAELDEIESDQGNLAVEAKLSLWTYLARPTVLATAFAFFGYAYILYFFLSWFPSYLTMEQHLSIQKMGVVSVIPWALGFIGLAGGGFVCDLVFRRTGDALFSRKLVLVVSLLIAAACVALAGTVTSVEAAVALMAVSVFFMYLTGSTYWAIILDTVEPARVGGVSGFVHLIANCAGIVAPAMTGFLVQSSGGFGGAFAAAPAHRRRRGVVHGELTGLIPDCRRAAAARAAGPARIG
jgi:ACS family hexuronate transporter-like MFS transporter